MLAVLVPRQKEPMAVILCLALLPLLAVEGAAQMQMQQEIQVVRAAALEIPPFLEGLELRGKDTQVEIALARPRVLAVVVQVALDQTQQVVLIMPLAATAAQVFLLQSLDRR